MRTGVLEPNKASTTRETTYFYKIIILWNKVFTIYYRKNVLLVKNGCMEKYEDVGKN